METYHEDDKDDDSTSTPTERFVPRVPEGILLFDRHHDELLRGGRDSPRDKDKDKEKSKKDTGTAPKPRLPERTVREVGRHVPLPWPEIVPRPTLTTEVSETKTDDDDKPHVTPTSTQSAQHPVHRQPGEADGVFVVPEASTSNKTETTDDDRPRTTAATPRATSGSHAAGLQGAAPEFVRVTPATETADDQAPASTRPMPQFSVAELRQEMQAQYNASQPTHVAETVPEASATDTEAPQFAPLMDGANPYYNGPNASPAATVGEWSQAALTIPTTPIERPKHTPQYAPNTGGVAAVAALLGLEHLGRKRADKKQNELIREIAKQQQESANGQQRMSEQQHRFTAEQRQQAARAEQMQQFQANPSGQERFSAAPVAPFAERLVTTSQARPERGAPSSAAMPTIHERIYPTGSSETQLAQAIPGEQLPNHPVEAGESIPLQPKQHVEHSSWHNIVVERGQAVPDAIQYGEGYQRERQQEVLRNRGADAAAGNQAYGATSSQDPYASYGAAPSYGVLPSGMTSPALPQGVPTHVDPQHQLPATNKKSAAGGMWFWLMLAIIVAAFFTAAFI